MGAGSGGAKYTEPEEGAGEAWQRLGLPERLCARAPQGEMVGRVEARAKAESPAQWIREGWGEKRLGRRLLGARVSEGHVGPKYPLMWTCSSRAQVGPQQWKWPSPDWTTVNLLGNIPQQVLGVFAQGGAEQVQSCGNGPSSLSFLPGHAPPSLL